MAEEQAVQAVSDGNLTLLHQLDLSSFINEQFRNKTLLYLACKKGFLEIVRFLFTVHGIDVNKGCRENFNRHSPLWISCNKGHLEIVKFLLEKNAQIGNDEREAFKDVKEKFALDLDLDELKEQVIRQISRQTETLRADQVRIQELEAMIRNLNSKLEQESAEKEQQLLEKDEIIQHLAEKNNDLNNILEHRWKQEEISIEFPSIKQVFNTSQKDIHIIKKELNRIDQQLYEIINKGLLIEENEFNQLIQERNKLRSEIVVKYSYNIFELETEKKNLHDKLNRLETTIREYQYYQEIFKNIQTNSNKETLLKSLSSIKLEIEELELSKDELSVEIRKQQRGKKATPQEISNLEKKLGEMCENLTHLNERQSEIQQSLSLLIPKFPEIIIEMKKILSVEQSNTSTKIMSPEEKFKLFALQNSILLTTSLSEYSNRTVLHTGLSVVYKATKSNKQIVILKEISITDTNCDTVMNEIMNIWRLKGHSRIIKLNGVFIESQFNKVYIETPYYSNGNLLEYINKIRSEHDSPTLKNMLRVIFRKVTETLQFIHSKEILHRDLKPQNILVNENGEPIIADFGSSKKLIAQLTNNTMGVGTLKYMALEVRRQEVPPSEKSDIWSLGVSLFECWKLIHNEQQGDLMTCSAADILNFDIDGNVVLPEKNLNFESDIMLMKLLKETFAINPDDRPSALTILTNEEYFTLDNAISTDLLSRSNQDLDNSERISLWQARLKKLKELSIQPNDIQFRNIRRIVLLDDISSVVEKVMKEKDICLIFNKTKVRFDEEGGIDAGGLSNELFSKYVEAMLLESNLFQKSDTSSIENFILTDTPLTEKSKSYLRTFGWLLKKLLIDSDDKTVYLPLNSFIFYYLLNGDIFKNQTVPMNDIILTLSKFLREYDFELDNQIMNMEKCKNDMELQSITYEETFVDVLSKSEKPLIMENVQLFILSQLYSYFYTSEKIEKIKLIKEGFDFFNLKQLKKSTSYSNRPLKEFLELQGSDFNERNLSVNELKILVNPTLMLI